MYRIVAIVALAFGLGLIATTVALQLFERTAGAERTTDRFRQLMSPAGLKDLRTDFETVRSAGLEFRDRTLPDFARALELSPAEMNAFVARSYPAVDEGVKAFPSIFRFVDPNLDSLEVSSDEFDSLDAIPAEGTSLTLAAWMMLALGVVLAVVGVAGLLRPGPVATGLVLAVGVVMVALPLGLGLPGKAADAREVGDIARGGLSQAGASQADAINDQLEAMVGEINTKMLPDIGRRLDLSAQQLQAQLGEDYPAVAKFLGMFDALLPEARGLAARQQDSVDDFAKADDTPIRAMPWIVLVPGALLALLAATALAVSRRSRVA